MWCRDTREVRTRQSSIRQAWLGRAGCGACQGSQGVNNVKLLVWRGGAHDGMYGACMTLWRSFVPQPPENACFSEEGWRLDGKRMGRPAVPSCYSLPYPSGTAAPVGLGWGRAHAAALIEKLVWLDYKWAAREKVCPVGQPAGAVLHADAVFISSQMSENNQRCMFGKMQQ